MRGAAPRRPDHGVPAGPPARTKLLLLFTTLTGRCLAPTSVILCAENPLSQPILVSLAQHFDEASSQLLANPQPSLPTVVHSGIICPCRVPTKPHHTSWFLHKLNPLHSLQRPSSAGARSAGSSACPCTVPLAVRPLLQPCPLQPPPLRPPSPARLLPAGTSKPAASHLWPNTHRTSRPTHWQKN